MLVEKAHVVGVEGVGQHQVRAAVHLQVVGAVVVVGVAVVQEAAVLHQQAPGVHRRRRLGMPAHRRATHRFLQGLHRAGDGGAFLRFIHAGMRLPAPAVAAHLIAALGRVRPDPRCGFERAAAGIHRQRHAVLVHHAGDAAIAHPRAVFEVAFHAQVGRTFHLLHRLVHGLVFLIPGGKAQFRAFLHIEHKGHGHPRTARPFHCRVVVVVSLQIAWHWFLRIRAGAQRGCRQESPWPGSCGTPPPWCP